MWTECSELNHVGFCHCALHICTLPHVLHSATTTPFFMGLCHLRNVKAHATFTCRKLDMEWSICTGELNRGFSKRGQYIGDYTTNPEHAHCQSTQGVYNTGIFAESAGWNPYILPLTRFGVKLSLLTYFGSFSIFTRKKDLLTIQ